MRPITDSAEVIPELKGMAFARAPAGFPVARIHPDEKWDRFLDEGMLQESAWTLRGGQAPTPFTSAVLRKNLVTYQQPAVEETCVDLLFPAAEIFVEGLVSQGCQFKELSAMEAWLGSNDGSLEAINMSTSMGDVFSKLGTDKNIGVKFNGSYLGDLCEEDYASVCGPDDVPMYVWNSKMSLKDARLPMENVAVNVLDGTGGKGRVFQGEALPYVITGRRLIGGFIGNYMKASARGSFVGIVSMILVRGGWDRLVRDLVEVDDSADIDNVEVFCGDLHKQDKNWLFRNHWWLCLIVGSLASSPEHARRIWRHYERIPYSPVMITIYGFICLLTKGHASGDIATVIFNSMWTILCYICVYLKFSPKEFWFYKDFDSNLRLKALGDDSASVLSTAMRSWLAMQNTTYEAEVIDMFARNNWEIDLAKKTINNIDFVGHTSVRAVTSHGVVYLPALPLRVVQSINEWMKELKKKEQPVYKEVADISRYHASVERSFPWLWSEDPIAKKYFCLVHAWETHWKHKFMESSIPEVVAAARGVPSLEELADLYFGWKMSRAEIMERMPLLNESVRDFENFTVESVKAETVGTGAGYVPTYGEYCGPGHPKVSDYTAKPVDELDAVCQMHDLCYDIGGDRADCDGAMAEDLGKIGEPDSTYGRLYMSVADKVMDFRGDQDRETLMEVIHKTSRSKNPRAVQQLLRRMNVPGKIINEVLPAIAELSKQDFKRHIEEQVLNVKGGKEAKRAARRERRKAKRAEKRAAQDLAVAATLKLGNRLDSRPRKVQRRARKSMKRKRSGFNQPLDRTRRGRGPLVPFKRSRHVEEGVCLIVDLSLPSASNSTGSLLVKDTTVNNVNRGFQLNPLNFPNSRLKQFAALYQKYRFRKLRFRFETALSKFNTGTFIHYVDNDCQADYTSQSGINVCEIMTQHKDCRPFGAGEDDILTWQPNDPTAAFWIKQTGDARTYTQGTYFFAVNDKIGTATGSLPDPAGCGKIWCYFECEFWEAAIGEGTATIPPDQIMGPEFNAWTALSTTVSGQNATSMQYDPIALVGMTMQGSKTVWDGGVSLGPSYGFDSSGDSYITKSISSAASGQLWLAEMDPNKAYTVRILYNNTAVTTAGVANASITYATTNNWNITKIYESVGTPGGTSAVYQCWLVLSGGTGGGCTLFCVNNPFTGTPTGASIANIVVYENVLGAGITLRAGCKYERLAKQGKSSLDLLQRWQPGDDCQESTCPVCPLGRVMLIAGRRHKEFEEPDSDSSSSSSDDEVELTHYHHHEKHAVEKPSLRLVDIEDLVPDGNIAKRSCGTLLKIYLSAKTDHERVECLAKTCSNNDCMYCAKLSSLDRARQTIELGVKEKL